MLGNDKVIWKEGLFLQPQHFQQTERYIFSSMQGRFAASQPYYFGFIHYEISQDALANNTFTLTNAKGIFPDGTYFSIPETGLAPQARTFSDHFAHDQMDLDVYLALPQINEGRPTVAEANITATGARYKSKKDPVTDEVFGQLKKEIEVGKANYTILFGDESRDNFSSIKVACLKRSSTGQIIIDSNFIAPSLRISSSSVLINLLRSMLELLLSKSVSLSQGRKQLKGGFAEFASDEITPLTLLLTLNSYAPLLNQYYTTMNVHPYDLYRTMLQFAGALCTFSAKTSTTALPVYDHISPARSFSELNHIIRDILGADISAGCIPIPLKEVSPATYVAQVSDTKLFETATFFLGIAADVSSEKELVIGSLTRIKMSSRNNLDTLIQSAMPGLPLVHVATPPQSLSTKPGYIYFSLSQRHMLWDTIKATATIAMYFPNNFPNLKLELLAVIS
jgi:type VI secretion system protein ImpJ